jgi:hypothetical protein
MVGGPPGFYLGLRLLWYLHGSLLSDLEMPPNFFARNVSRDGLGLHGLSSRFERSAIEGMYQSYFPGWSGGIHVWRPLVRAEQQFGPCDLACVCANHTTHGLPGVPPTDCAKNGISLSVRARRHGQYIPYSDALQHTP